MILWCPWQVLVGCCLAGLFPSCCRLGLGMPWRLGRLDCCVVVVMAPFPMARGDVIEVL